VTETLELKDELQRHLGRALEAVVVNGILPQRFTAAELRRIARLNGAGVPTGEAAAGGAGGRAQTQAVLRSEAVLRSAALAARAVHDRARFQHNQVARLRRRRFEVLGVPFVFAAQLDLAAVRRIAEHLGRRL
jgi:hypothetical protein